MIPKVKGTLDGDYKWVPPDKNTPNSNSRSIRKIHGKKSNSNDFQNCSHCGKVFEGVLSIQGHTPVPQVLGHQKYFAFISFTCRDKPKISGDFVCGFAGFRWREGLVAPIVEKTYLPRDRGSF